MAIKKTIGSRRSVYNGTALRTKGNLTKGDLRKTKKGRLVSRRASAAAKKKLARNPKFKKYVAMAKARKGKPFKKFRKI